MAVSHWVYELFGASYALSIVLFFVDAFHPRRSVNRTALLLLFVAFVLETIFLFVRLRLQGQIPVYTKLDSLLLLSWVIMLLALVVDTFYRVDLLLFMANVIGFGFVVFDLFGGVMQTKYSARVGDLLALHIALAVLSYAAFTFAFAFSLMYLIQDRLLRTKRFTRWYFRLPSLERLDRYANRAILMGFPLLTVAMVLGMVWGKLTVGNFLFTDPKSVFTECLWCMYGIYLLLHVKNGWGGTKLMQYNLVCYIGVIVNFLYIGKLSFFHHAG